MAVIKLVPYSEKENALYFFCKGCNCEHAISILWSWNYRYDKPTFRPSILERGKLNGKTNQGCHSFITNGEIRYLKDCTHKLKNKTIALPEIF